MHSRFFGDPTLAASSAEEKGRRLAELIGKRRALLILDGLEPLHTPTSPKAGLLRDVGVAALLKGLANHTRVVRVTTRISIQT